MATFLHLNKMRFSEDSYIPGLGRINIPNSDIYDPSDSITNPFLRIPNPDIYDPVDNFVGMNRFPNPDIYDPMDFVPLPPPSMVSPPPLPITPMGIDNFQAGMQQVMGPSQGYFTPYRQAPTSTDLGPGYGPYDIAGYGPW